jgi:thiamine biosynthesis lipoprotein
MGTGMSIMVVADAPEAEVQAAMQRALDWFAAVERACSRFDPASELRRLQDQPGEPIAVSPILFEALRFALALADQTHGVFDPTLGHALEAQGFNRHYVTGESIVTPTPSAGFGTYQDVRLRPSRRTVQLRKPVTLDLGAVAKGLAVDLASRELLPFVHFCVDAGGDLYAHGLNPEGQPWRIGIQDPNDPEALVQVLAVQNQAVCTSGSYEKRTPDGTGHHLLDPRTGQSARGLVSATVIAPTAMAADGLATAAFVLGPKRGLHFLQRQGVEGLLIVPTGEMLATGGLGMAQRPATP